MNEAIYNGLPAVFISAGTTAEEINLDGLEANRMIYKMQIEYPEEHRNIYTASTFWELANFLEALIPLAGGDLTVRVKRIEPEATE